MSDYLCPRCAADPRPENFGNDRQCAFSADGSFSPDNWNCATMSLLVDAAQNVIHGCDEQMEVRPVNREDYGGWLITSRYKHRGCTSSAIIVGDFYPPVPLTLARAEAILSGDHLETWETTHVEEPQSPLSATRIDRDKSEAP